MSRREVHTPQDSMTSILRYTNWASVICCKLSITFKLLIGIPGQIEFNSDGLSGKSPLTLMFIFSSICICDSAVVV